MIKKNIENSNESPKPELGISNIIGSTSEWNKLAEAIKNEFGETIIDEGDVDNPYDWWLVDVTVSDIINFLKNYQ